MLSKIVTGNNNFEDILQKRKVYPFINDTTQHIKYSN